MVEGKMETLSTIVNLFILLLIITLGGTLYNGAKTNGSYVLGWICVFQVCFFYIGLIYIKFRYIPSIERKLKSMIFEGFRLYASIEKG
jgi:hypothetical protein